jgi:diguanylate cyclase
MVNVPMAAGVPALPPRPATAMRRDGVLIGVVGLIVGCLVWFGFGVGTLGTQAATCWVLMTSLHVTLAFTAGRIYRHPGATKTTGRVWASIGFAGAAYAVGDIAQLVAIAFKPVSVDAALGSMGQSLSVAVGTGVVVVVMLTTPIGLESRRERTQFWLDAGVVMAAATSFGVYNYAPGDASTLSHVVLSLLLGPGLFLVGVFAVVRLVLSAHSPISKRAGLALAAAAVLEGVVQAASSVLVDNGRLSWLLGLSVIASTVLLGSARIQQLQVRAEMANTWSRPQRRFSALPYTAIVATYLLLVWVLAKDGLNVHVWIVVAGAILSTALVIVRQLAAFADNARLLDELDETVDRLRELLAEREFLTAELRHQAFHDPLTGLANRALLDDRLQFALNSARPVATRWALMIVDLDDFKEVNDRFGHAAGDELLVGAGRRLRNCVREPDLVVRVGGDEFAVLVDNPKGEPHEIAKRIVEAIAQPFTLSCGTASVSASVGVVVFDGAGRTAEELQHDADTAMYQAKRAGKGEYRVHA